MNGPGQDRPLLSVVIPVFNERPYLRETLSALQEAITRAGLPEASEVIVVDDGSTDGSCETVADEWKIDVGLITQENQGRLAARRRGIEATRGKFVLTLDARVALDPDTLRFWAEQRRTHPDRELWNGHTRPRVEDNPYTAFWDLLTRAGWSAYHADPRLVSYSIEEFDRFPKGTGMFVAPRMAWEQAYQAMDAASGRGGVAARLRSDDTALIRQMMGPGTCVWLSPEFGGSHTSGRADLSSFLRHARDRGVRFVDSYFSSPSAVGRAVRLLPALLPLLLIGLGVVFLEMGLVTLLALALVALVAVAWVAARADYESVSRLRVGLTVLPFVLAFSSGMLGGYLIRGLARVRSLRPGGVVMVSGAGLAASGLSFIVFVMAGRELSTEAFGDFAAVWGALFGGASILSAFEMESARRSASGETAHRPLIALSFVVTALAILASPLLVPAISAVFAVEDGEAVLPLFLGLALYPQFLVLRGWLAGRKQLKQYSLASLLEGLLRPLALLATGIGATWKFTLAAAAGAAAWLPWIPAFFRLNGASEQPAPAGMDYGWGATLRALGNLMSGQVAAAILVTGMPATLTVILGRGDDESLALAIVLITVSRLPLIVLSSFYGLLVPWFVGREQRGWGAHRIVTVTVAAASLAVVGGFVTLLVLDLFFPETLTPTYLQAVVYVLGALALGGITVGVAKLVAEGRHRVVQITWWATAILTSALLLLIRIFLVPIVLGVGIALTVGPAVGLWISYRAGRGSRDRSNRVHVAEGKRPRE